MLQRNSFGLNTEQAQRAKHLSQKFCGIIAVGLAYYALVSIIGFGIPCPIRAITGFECAGCGVTRMCASLLGLDFGSAFEYNPVIFCSLPFLAVCFGAQAVKYIKTGSNKLSLWQNVIVWVAIAALLIFGIIRNFI